MRGYVGGQHVGVSAGIPGPTAAMGFLGFMFTLPLWIVIIVLWGITVGFYLIWCLALVAWWLIKFVAIALAFITAPIWYPIWWLWNRSHPLPPAPPAPLPPPQFGATRG